MKNSVKEDDKHILFVYGSLMRNRYNHSAFMSDSVFLGKASIQGFALYDLGYYPGILHDSNDSRVLGELYEVDGDAFERICHLEGNGFLYQCETVAARSDHYSGEVMAEVFVYLGSVKDDKRIMENEQPWRDGKERANEMKYVWYACYGSNISKERFMRYINQCTDKTEPVEDRPYEFVNPVYFAGTAENWEKKGKAFLDDTAHGHAYGRIYKITREQYEEVKEREGRDYTKKVDLGMLEGIPVISFTCENRPGRSIPSLKYLNTILTGLRETYPDIRESAVAADLIRGIFDDDEIKVLDCMRESAHGLEIRTIANLASLEPQRVQDVVETLTSLHVIRQDSRSMRYETTDEGAVFYTERNERELIDRIRALSNDEEVMRNVPADDPLITSVVVEGGRRMILTTRYERNPANRRAAIRLHGTVCRVCGFDFLEHYGELGRDYIEVHHLRPLSTLEEQVQVDPETDLVCLCANCHRMMHRSRDHVMTVEELQQIYRP